MFFVNFMLQLHALASSKRFQYVANFHKPALLLISRLVGSWKRGNCIVSFEMDLKFILHL